MEGATTQQALPALFKIDKLLGEDHRQLVHDFLRRGSWKFGWKSHGHGIDRDQYSFWHRHFAGHRNGRKQAKYDCAEELKQNAPLMHAFWTHLAATAFKGHTLIRCYANAHAYGVDGTIHTDSKQDNSYTAVYYPHDVWEPNWAGETVLFNAERDDILASVYPMPNRLLVFQGNIPHVARGVSRTCPVLRITLMFKTLHGPIGSEATDDQQAA